MVLLQPPSGQDSKKIDVATLRLRVCGEAETEDSPTPQGLRRGRIPDLLYFMAVEARRSLRRRPSSLSDFAAKRLIDFSLG